ncbi:DUF349 domain-containing protein [Balneola vulgaris]|uniref:DUF349 domain-containing protein n=1 Tax=Balneola vulgaris TaxID=287535 RepID=UPI00039B5D11|nr:DUF349 domain-containing protein [Balneola vulgaris]
MNLEQEKNTEEEMNVDATNAETETTEAEEKVEAEVDEEVETTEESSEVETVAESESEVEESEENSAADFYNEILAKAKEFVKSNDWALVSNEFANQGLHISDGPAPNDEESKAAFKEYEELKADFEERKKAHYEELNKKREENLVKKKDLLKEFAAIVNEEKWSATKEVAQIKNKWEHIKQVPHNEIEALNERFEALMKEFESHKVDRLVKKLQKEEENLTLKLLILDKMDALNQKSNTEEADFNALNEEFEDLLSQWRKIGRVPVEKNEGVWDRFNAAQDVFNELRFKHDKEYRKRIEAALKKKKKLIAEAESLIDDKNIAEAARRVNKLHKAWKKTANLPQKDENELWDQFKAATDSFNEKKSDNLEVLREQEQKNLDHKEALIEKAQKVKDTDNYEEGHRMMQDLMKEWKAIGPVPRKKSSKIWKKFKGAMDDFYESRRDHFKERRGEQKDNLAVKKEIIDKLIALGEHEDPAKAVEEAKKLQADFKDAGHVPIKAKNKIWKQYREACDVIYDRFRAMGSDLGAERELASQGYEPEERKQIIKLQKEQSALKKDISKLEAEVIQYKEAQTYFKPTNKGNKLKDELQEKITKAEGRITEKQHRLVEIDKEINTFSDSDEEE